MADTQARVVVEPTGVVRVHVSPDALYNVDEIQRLQREVLGRIGCSACCSGRQIIFQQAEVEFNV
jgi:hypothetical protein